MFFFFSKILPQSNNKSGLFGNLLTMMKLGNVLSLQSFTSAEYALREPQFRIFGKVGYLFPNFFSKNPRWWAPLRPIHELNQKCSNLVPWFIFSQANACSGNYCWCCLTPKSKPAQAHRHNHPWKRSGIELVQIYFVFYCLGVTLRAMEK